MDGSKRGHRRALDTRHCLKLDTDKKYPKLDWLDPIKWHPHFVIMYDSYLGESTVLLVLSYMIT